MAHTVPLSHVADAATHAAAVSAHIVELEAWTRQVDAVTRTAHLATGHPDKHDYYPPPSAPPHVERSVHIDKTDGGGVRYSADYEVVDDGPTPDQVLRAKKDALLSAISQAEQGAIAKLHPIGYRRAHAHRRGMIEAAGTKLSGEDAEFAARHDERMAKIAALEQWGAAAMAAVEDLDATTIDTWQHPEAPR